MAYEEEVRFWDIRSDEFAKIIDTHIKACFSDINALLNDKGIIYTKPRWKERK